MRSVRGVDPGHGACSGVAEMITDKFAVPVMPMVVAMMYADIKICQHKKSGKPEIPPPERIRHPAVEVCIIGRRSIVGNDRRSLFVIIIVYDSGVGIIRSRIFAGVLTRSIRPCGQRIPGYDVLK